MVKLINLDTGDVMECESYSLVERGIPEGYKIAKNITTDGWIKYYCELLNSK